jgi:hypothetical protein
MENATRWKRGSTTRAKILAMGEEEEFNLIGFPA